MSRPTIATVKRLFAVSGNQCAFPDCTMPLVHSTSGTVTGEICHIKARSPDGPRYDPNQDDKQRHAFDNLLLMCPAHHKVIDHDPETYTVAKLLQIKAYHEARHAGGPEPANDIAHQFLVQVDIHHDVIYGDKVGIKIVHPTPSPPPVPLQLPPRAEHFTGRQAELAQLLADLQPGRVVTLCGPGGIGKTALAAEAIWTLVPADGPPERFPDGIIFHSFYNQPQAALALEAIARACGEEPRPSPAAAARRVLAGQRALLVLDGAESADDLPAVLAVRGGCGVLVTSRARQDAVADRQDLTPLPDDDAVQLLQAWGGARAADEAAARRLCELVGRLPLAVRLAGRYLVQREEEAADYLAWLRETPLAALDQGQRQHESVPLLLGRSIAQVSEAARRALGVVGLLALSPFGRAAIAAALDACPELVEGVTPAEAGRLLGELVNYGLLLREAACYQVSHALVHTYARRRMSPPADVTGRLAAYYTALAEEQTALGLPGYAILDPERPHLMAILAGCVAAENWDEAESLAWAVDGYLDIQGHSTERVTAIEAGLAAARALDHRRDEEAFLIMLGLAHHALGQVERAIRYYDEALVICQEITHRQDEGNVLGNLGLAYSALGEVGRAIEYYEQALAISREIGDRRGEGADLGNLGNAYSDLGEVGRALEYYEQCLTIHREIGDRRGEGADLGNLGLAYRDLGEVGRAIEYYEQALEIAREIGDRRGEGNRLGSLGNAYRDLGEVGRAIEYYEQALEIAREIGDRRGEAFHCWNLGLLYEESDPARATELMQVCVDYEREIGHPDAEPDAQRVRALLAGLAGAELTDKTPN